MGEIQKCGFCSRKIIRDHDGVWETLGNQEKHTKGCKKCASPKSADHSHVPFPKESKLTCVLAFSGAKGRLYIRKVLRVTIGQLNVLHTRDFRQALRLSPRHAEFWARELRSLGLPIQIEPAPIERKFLG